MREILTGNFRDSMEILYGKTPVDNQQLMDMVKVYVMGWGDSANYYDLPAVTVESYLSFAQELTFPDWKPGDEWRWWL
jgi:hypothetical protein